ncbi:MAG: hypothetical protein JNM14_16705 [Ferruginibacter sp.]|nr:hypothetical protein [Ferruginibacter sp.]
MAKQTGPFYITGTLGGITFYKRKGSWVARKKTSLNKKRVKTDPAFEGSRRASACFGAAAKLAKKIYWQLPANKRGRGVIGKITGLVNTMLREGIAPETIEATILKSYT